MSKKIILINILLIVFMSILFFSCSSDNKDIAKEGQLWTCGMHPEVLLDEPGQCPKCGMNLTPVKQTFKSEAGYEHQDHTMQLYTCPMHPEVLAKEAGSCPECGMDLVPVKQEKKGSSEAKGERKILYWQAPMDPTEIYDHPGKSKMGMDLVPVYEDQVSSGSTVTIDPVTVQNMGVRTALVKRVDFERSIRTVGEIDYNEEKIYIVSSKIKGWIEKLHVDYTGKVVRKGEPLLEIYSPELVTTQQEYLLALKNKKLIGESKFASIKEGAESLLQSAKQRFLYWDIPESVIKQLEKSGEVRKTLTLQSPVNGTVIHKNAVEGLHIMEGMSLYKIADLSKVWVYASIYDNELPWVEAGQKVEMELSYAPGKILQGRVVYIYPYLNEKARDVKIRLEFPNADLKLKPGMYTNIHLQVPPIKNALVVPSEAVIRSGQRNLVFIAKEGGRFQPREVRIGEESDNGKIRILSGLMEREKVVISGQFLLDSESRLQEAIQKMLEEKNKPHVSSKKVHQSTGAHEHQNIK